MKTTGERLRLFAAITYGSSKALGEAIGMSPSSIQHYIDGKRKAGSEILEKLWLLGCSTEWLLFGTGEMYARNDTGRQLRARQDSNISELLGGKKFKRLPKLVDEQIKE